MSLSTLPKCSNYQKCRSSPEKCARGIKEHTTCTDAGCLGSLLGKPNYANQRSAHWVRAETAYCCAGTGIEWEECIKQTKTLFPQFPYLHELQENITDVAEAGDIYLKQPYQPISTPIGSLVRTRCQKYQRAVAYVCTILDDAVTANLNVKKLAKDGWLDDTLRSCMKKNMVDAKEHLSGWLENINNRMAKGELTPRKAAKKARRARKEEKRERKKARRAAREVKALRKNKKLAGKETSEAIHMDSSEEEPASGPAAAGSPQNMDLALAPRQDAKTGTAVVSGGPEFPNIDSNRRLADIEAPHGLFIFAPILMFLMLIYLILRKPAAKWNSMSSSTKDLSVTTEKPVLRRQ